MATQSPEGGEGNAVKCANLNANVEFCHLKSIFITINKGWLSDRARSDTCAVT